MAVESSKEFYHKLRPGDIMFNNHRGLFLVISCVECVWHDNIAHIITYVYNGRIYNHYTHARIEDTVDCLPTRAFE